MDCDIFPDSNAFITILYRIPITDYNGIFHNSVCVIGNTVIVISQYDGIGHIHKTVLRPDHIRILGIGHLVLEPIHQVVLADGIFRSLQYIADTHDLGRLGIVNRVAAAHDHDLAATFRNGFLQDFCNFLHIILLVCLHQCLQGLFIQLHVLIGIGDFIAGPHNDCCIGILGIVHLTDDTIGNSIEVNLCSGIDDI